MEKMNFVDLIFKIAGVSLPRRPYKPPTQSYTRTDLIRMEKAAQKRARKTKKENR